MTSSFSSPQVTFLFSSDGLVNHTFFTRNLSTTYCFAQTNGIDSISGTWSTFSTQEDLLECRTFARMCDTKLLAMLVSA